jgi:uncharacterized protein
LFSGDSSAGIGGNRLYSRGKSGYEKPFPFLSECQVMSEPESTSDLPQPAAPRWQPIAKIDRRVLGVLVEKAKTTPEAYPMSLNAITTGCNQKNNRAPVMQLEPDQVEEALERLREMGAVGLIEGHGRVPKYRHYLYQWLGVEKVELAVMAELLLRGDQTEGELRARASRMEPIPDLAALRTILDSLMAKGLVISLTPEGRGHVLTHALYHPPELERLKSQYSGRVSAEPAEGDAESLSPAAAPARPDEIAALRQELAELRSALEALADEFRRFKSALGE